jgi:CheY-like chemotaxis protein
VLVRAGAVVKTADSAAAAYELLQQFRPDVLVSDIAMPDEDGYGLMRRIRALDPALGGAIPSLALTAYTRGEDKTKALAVGFATHISKPVNPDDLIVAVANLAHLTMKPTAS